MVGEEPSAKAIVVFEDRPEAHLLRWLEPGFRHCFCLLEQARGWVLCDPLKGSLRIESLGFLDEEALIAGLALPGRTVLAGRAAPSSARGFPLRPITCVEIVKRALGWPSPLVVTPRQLCRFLVDGRGRVPRFTIRHQSRIDGGTNRM